MQKCNQMVLLVTVTVANCLFVLLIVGKPNFYSFGITGRHYSMTSKDNVDLVRMQENAFRDISQEFERGTDSLDQSFNVFAALEKDNYELTPLSSSWTTEPNWKDDNDSISVNSAETLNVTLQAPNVVHYVFLGSDLTFTFTNYLSYRSVDRFIKPEQIFIHGDRIPIGRWWNRTINEVRNIYHVNRTHSSKAPNGQTYRYPAHISDYMRAEILLRYGGIYLDADVLIVKSFSPLRRYAAVIGRERANGLCNGIMIARRGAPFLRLLLEQYRSYRGPTEIWAEKSVLNTHKLAELYPHLIHVEETTLNRPNCEDKEQIFDGRYNWKQNYAVHLWVRLWPADKRPNGVKDILTKNTTLGELARRIIFGSDRIENGTLDY